MANSSVVLKDSRSKAYPGPRHDAAAMLEVMGRFTDTHPHVATMVDSFVTKLDGDTEEAEALSAAYYSKTVDAILAGIELTMLNGS